MEIRPLDASDNEALRRWHATYLAADTLGREHPMPWTKREMRADFLVDRPGELVLGYGGYLAADSPDSPDRTDPVVATGVVQLPLMDNRHVARLAVHTHPDHRGRGHGSAMLAHLTAVAREHERSVLSVEVFVPFSLPTDGDGHPDVAFANRHGFRLDLSNVVRRVALPVPDEHLEQLADEAAPYHRDYTLRQFRGPVPDDIVADFGDLVGSLMTEAPSGELQREKELLDEERIRADERVFAESGRIKYTTVAVDPDGRLAAYTELMVAEDGDNVFQWGTLVRSAHRGHRLGMATKVHNLRWLQEEHPERSALLTMNAEVNAQMIAINEALGFRPVERLLELEKRLA